MVFKPIMTLVIGAILIILFFQSPCFCETYRWQDPSHPYAEEIDLSTPADLMVSLPASLVNADKEIPLLVDVMLTTGYGTISLSINDNLNNKLLITRDQSGEVVLKIPTSILKAGENKLYFFDEKGFAGNFIRHLEFVGLTEDKENSLPDNNLSVSDGQLKSLTIPDELKSRIAVIQFNSLNISDADTNWALMLSEMFTTELVMLKAFNLIEREHLNKVLAEQSLAQTGVLDSNDVQKIGNILGIRAIVTGTVIRVGEMLRIDSRFIDVESGMVLTAESLVVPFDLHTIEAGVRKNVLKMTRAYYKKMNIL